MKKYVLKKDLPTFEAGCLFEMNNNGDLVFVETASGARIKTLNLIAYAAQTISQFPSILTDWFEEIPEKPRTVWDLEEGDEWYFINYSTDSCYISSTNNLSCIKAFREIGNVFLTREAAEKELARRKAKTILERDAKGFKPDWTANNQNKHIVFYCHKHCHLCTDFWSTYNAGDMYFATREDAEASIKAHEKEWKIYLGVEGE